MVCHLALLGVECHIADIKRGLRRNELHKISESVLRDAAKFYTREVKTIYPLCKGTWDRNDQIKVYNKLRDIGEKIGRGEEP